MKRISLYMVPALLAALLLGMAGTLSAQPATVAEAVQPYIDRNEFPGIVSITADKDGQLTVECAGWADAECKIPMSPDRFFWIASMTKGITAAALLTLVDEGRVDLDAPVETYLPEFKDVRVEEVGENGVSTLRPPKSKPTVRQVMSHMSGWRFMTPQMNQFGIDVFPPRQLASTAVQVPLTTDPGTAFDYSNLGIDIGSAIIEQVSGMPFDLFLRKRLFEPLNMYETDFWLTEEQQTRMITPYTVLNGKLIPQIVPQLTYPLSDRTRRFAEAGGGLFSTPRDLIKFYQMIAGRGVFRGKRILSENAVKEMATKQTPEGIDTPYSLGMWTDGEWIWHGGALQTEGRANINTGEARIYIVQLTSSVDPAIKESVNAVLNSRVK